MLDRILQFIRAERLITEDSRVLVGFSGGPDSTCLLHALVQLGFTCVCAHLHHGQRAEADAEVEAGRRFAMELGVEFALGNADVPRMAAELGIGLEEAGREARYSFFEQAARQFRCDAIATAHTLDDHLETVLLNLARGTGMTGLRGIPIRRDEIVRPLLCLSKADTYSYCADNGLSYFHDPANDDVNFSRARVRHRVVPELRLLNASVASAAFRMSKIVAEEDDFLNGMAAAALEQSERFGNKELAFLSQDVEIVLDRDRICSLPAVLFKRAMMLSSKVLGSPFDSKHILAILAGVTEGEKGSVTAPDGLVTAEWNTKSLSLHRREEVEPYRGTLDVPDEVMNYSMGWALTVSTEPASDMRPERRSLTAHIPVNSLKRPLYFRNLEPGDRMVPIGFSGHRKLSDLVAEAGVSEIARARLPVVCDLVGPLWVPGVCLDERATRTNGVENDITFRFGGLT